MIDFLEGLHDALDLEILADQVKFFKQNVQDNVFDFNNIMVVLDKLKEDAPAVSGDRSNSEARMRESRAAALAEAEAKKEAHAKDVAGLL